MENRVFTVKSNEELSPGVFRMSLEGDTSAITRPGQFVNIALDGLYLRRPISVCDLEGNTLTLVYKLVGRGTLAMSALHPGTPLDLLTGLGNGYDISKCANAPLLVGGGVGAPPLYLLAKRLLEKGLTPKIVLGFNKMSEIFLAKEFRELGLEVYITIADGDKEPGFQEWLGSEGLIGKAGFVTSAFEAAGNFDYVFACGPEPMLKAVYDAMEADGQFSFEERMGCGFGACMGCSCKTKYGNKRICREGPVLEKGEIIW